MTEQLKSITSESSIVLPAIFILQIVFNILKVYEIQYSYERKLMPLLVNSVFYNLVTILGTYLSIDSLFKGDWFVIVVFVAGSLVGKYLAIKMTDFGRIYKIKIYRIKKKYSNKR